MADKKFPRYKCHKQVQAFKISRLHILNQDGGGAELFSEGSNHYVVVSEAYLQKHNPKAGGYYVLYDDDYESWSPAQAFEQGYSLVYESGNRPKLKEHASVTREDPVERMVADCTAEEFVDWLIWRGSVEQHEKDTIESNLREQFKWHRLQGRLDRSAPWLSMLAELWSLRAKNKLEKPAERHLED
jgi:hypothetical protein